MTDTHGPVRMLVERMYDTTRSYMLAPDEGASIPYLEKWKRICAEADALDAHRWPAPTDEAAQALADAWRREMLAHDGIKEIAAAVLERLQGAQSE